MNEIDLLKQVRADVPQPDPMALARARQRLLSPSPSPVRGRPITLRRTIIAGTLAATLAGGFLINDVVVKDGAPPPGAVADAGTFLAAAADHTSASPDAPIPSGQYRQITQRSQRSWNFGPRNSYRGTGLDVTNLWIGADRNPPYTAISVLDAKKAFSSEAARKYWATVDPLNVEPQTLKSREVCAVGTNGGSLRVRPKGAKNGCRPSWFTPTPAFLAQLPRDPDRLLARLRTNDGLPPVPSPARIATAPFDRATLILASGIAPADLRAALYQAIRMIPGISLQADAVNLDGRTGRAVSQLQQFGVRKELIIDPRTGQFIGLREVATITAPLNGDGDPMSYRRGDIISWTSVATQITPIRPTIR
ncbi:CU044_5270 family protein [Kribbella sp. CA-247076]|uniref:CU044_5270 family protein n=1 Tax=Kribbella sp. CA-247076 TaxID=3239941 RepID=UPI003D8F8BBC